MRTTGLALLAILVGLGAGIALHPADATAAVDTHQRVVCKVFPATLTDDPGWDSDDDRHPVGAWVKSMGERGWAIASVQLGTRWPVRARPRPVS